ncbi:MAG TPA: serine hydrolase [Pyrinomonadaceae bacterium]|nr:serine hydrolase [Pyrinomonadaceae bacterium]
MKSKPIIRLLIAVVLLTGVQIARAQQVSELGPGFDDYVNNAIKNWQVPGIAISIIKDDRIVFAKGYGVRELGKPTPVDERTMFAIGSSSKAFTAAAIAMLIDEGKVKWDDPVTKHLPGFQLYDPYSTRELTVGDLLTHRSGLTRGDLLWYASAYDRDEVLRRVRYLKPTWSLRSRFGYQNIMFLAAGQIFPSIAGKNWDDFIRERIFNPLGMTASTTSIKALANSDNVATPHSRIDDKVQTVAWRNIDNIAPAGSINSNVTDMAQWVRLQLGGGTYENKRLLSSGAMKEMHTPQTIIRLEGPQERLYPEAHFLTYGMGWFLSDYRGRKVVEHGGAIDGMRAQVAMMPEEKLGMVILSNLNGAVLPHALMYRIFDSFLGAPQRDWSAEMLKTITALEEQAKAAEKKIESERVMGTAPSLSIDKYAATYNSDMYGEAKVAVENGKLVTRFGPNFTGDLEHWHYDTFRVTWRDRMQGKGFVNFRLNAQGKIESISIENLSEFTRAPDKPEAVAGIKLSEEDLRKFVGRYALEAPPVEISIELIGGSLKATVPGQPVYTLVPVAADRFQLEGAPAGFFVQFELADGKPKNLTLVQGSRPSIVLLPKP